MFILNLLIVIKVSAGAVFFYACMLGSPVTRDYKQGLVGAQKRGHANWAWSSFSL